MLKQLVFFLSSAPITPFLRSVPSTRSFKSFRLQVSVAERVRASLDGKKSLCSDSVLVLGGQNAQVLSEVLGGTFVELPTVPDVSQCLTLHSYEIQSNSESKTMHVVQLNVLSILV